MFLLLHGTPGVKGYREVIPGVYYGAATGLEEMTKGNRLLDYRLFFGYSGWGVEQLKKEIDAGLWYVAASSTDLITGHSAAGLWEEILGLMGGKYSELGKRPRRRPF
jgi:putative transcriptional regulator